MSRTKFFDFSQKTERLSSFGLGRIVISFFLSFLLNAFFWKRGLFFPDFIALSLIYWSIFQPNKAGFFVAFSLGIIMDVHSGSVLGQNALAYISIVYVTLLCRSRFLSFSAIEQAVQIFPILFFAQLIVLCIRFWFDGIWPGLGWFLQSLLGAMIYPFWCVLLKYQPFHK